MPSITTFYLLHAAGLVSVNPEPISTQTAQYTQNIVWYKNRQTPPKKMTIRNYLRELSEHEAHNYFVYDVRVIASLLWLTQEDRVNRTRINELAHKIASGIDTIEVSRNKNKRPAQIRQLAGSSIRRYAGTARDIKIGSHIEMSVCLAL